MGKEGAYLIILLIIAMFLVVVVTNPPEDLSLTGKVVEGNLTDNQTEETNITEEVNTTTETNTTEETNITEEVNTTTETNTTEETNITEEVNTTTNETCTENWSCVEWNDCFDGTQIRTCTDANTCDTELNKPNETQSCEVIEDNEEEVEEESTVQVTLEESKAATGGDQVVEAPKETQPQPAPEPVPEPAPQEVVSAPPEDSAITGKIIGPDNETCYGCVLKDNCYEEGDRKKGKYCLANTEWANQTAFNQTCAEDYMCKSGNCLDETCGKFNLIKSLKNWFKNLFSFTPKLNATENSS